MRRGATVACAVAALALTTASCASMTQNEEWTGRPIDQALAKLGTPSRVTPGENGQTTYVWMIHHAGTITRTTLNPNGQPVDISIPYDSIETWTFLAGPDGTIVTWSRSKT